MKCAILGNGPSRSLYSPENNYSIIIGCNIPWTKVDWTMVMDEEVILAWSKNPQLITCPLYASVEAWRYSAAIKFREYIIGQSLFLGLFERPKEISDIKYCSGHFAAIKAIELGYKHLDLYGMDSYFEDNIESSTREFIPRVPTNNAAKWRKVWNEIISSNPEVVFNFIRE